MTATADFDVLGLLKLDTRNRVVLPPDLVASWKLKPGDRVGVWMDRAGRVLLYPGGAVPGSPVRAVDQGPGIPEKKSDIERTFDVKDGKVIDTYHAPKGGWTGEKIHDHVKKGWSLRRIAKKAGVDYAAIQRRYTKFRKEMDPDQAEKR